MSLPLPPKGANVTSTVCQFCNVGCGYLVYTWPIGEDGGKAPENNAFGADFRVPQPLLTGIPYTEAMTTTIETREGRRQVAIVPAPDSDINRMRDHSPRGGSNAQTTYSRLRGTGQRLTSPLLRVGDSLVAVTWEEALTVLAGVLVGVRDRDGVDAVCAKAFDHGGGGGGFENNFGVGKLLFTGLGTKMVAIHNRPAYNSEVWGSRDRGVHELHYCTEDTRVCDTLFLWGANTYETATVLATEHILPHFAGNTHSEKESLFDKGESIEPLRVVVVDPRRTATVTLLQSIDAARVLHLRPAPGTDLVLANAMAAVAWRRGWHDQAMLDARTNTAAFEEYSAKNLGGKTSLGKILAEAERITTVPQKDIVKAAEWFAKPKGKSRRRTLTLYEKGMIWNYRNYDTIAALVQLAVLCGHIGRPGTGCGRQGGHQEGYVRPDYPGPRPPPNVDQHLIDGGGKVLWVMGTNPYLTTPRAQQYRAKIHARTVALTQKIVSSRGGEPATPEARAAAIVAGLAQGEGLFLVVSELYLTDTARDAHLVLPAAGWGEMDMTSINCNSRLLRLYGKFMDPPGLARPDWEICAMTARRMAALYTAAGKTEQAARFSGFDWKTDAEVFVAGAAMFPPNQVDEVGADALPCETYAGLTHALLKEMGQQGIQTPVRKDPQSGKIVGTKRRYSHRFGTADGKFQWQGADGWTGYPSEVQRYLDGEGSKKWPFWLTTGRCQRLWQTGYHDQHQPEKMAEVPLPYIELHPDDATRLGCVTGDLAEVYNDEGNLVAQVRVLDSPPAGMIFALQFHPLGTANDLTSPYTDPKTTIPWYKGTRVAVRKLVGEPGDARELLSLRRVNVFD